jgi:hypothetical protein
MSATTHLRWRGYRTRCGIGTSMTYNHERVTCRTCLRLGPQQLELIPRQPLGQSASIIEADGRPGT